jgi:hypothetical protein
MNTTAAIALVGLGAIGLHAIGSAAVSHKRAIGKGELPTHVPEDYGSTVFEDLVAFTASMVMLGVVFDQTPAMITQAQELMR